MKMIALLIALIGAVVYRVLCGPAAPLTVTLPDGQLADLALAMPVFGIIINAESLSGIFKSFSTIFNQAFAETQVLYEKVAMRVPSSVRETTYAWLGVFPKMREWLGDRVMKNLTASGYTITNKDYEATVEVDRNDIEDDQFGVYTPAIAEMGRSAKAHPDELVFDLLSKGFETQCYDGQFFFDTDHPVGNGVASNHGGGASTAWFLLDTTRAVKPIIFQQRKAPEFVAMDKPTDENVFMRKKLRYGVDSRDNVGYGLWQLAYGSKQTLNADNYKAARAAMMAMKDDEGKPLGIMPNLLVVPPSLEGAARELLLAERTGAGATNPWKGTAEPLVVAWLT